MAYRRANPWGRIKPPPGAAIGVGRGGLVNGFATSQGIAGCWLFNESGGVNAYDISGRSNTGVLTSAPVWTPGLFGMGLKFAGTNYVSITNRAQLHAIKNGSVSAWIKTAAAGSSYRGVVALNGCYGMFLLDNVFGVFDWGTSAFRSSTVNVADSLWHHVAFTFQSGVTSGTVLYLDGKAKLTTTITNSAPGGAPVQIGGNNGSQLYTGWIDHAMIFDRVLSPWDIAQLYAQPFSNIVAPRRRVSGIAPPATGHFFRMF